MRATAASTSVKVDDASSGLDNGQILVSSFTQIRAVLSGRVAVSEDVSILVYMYLTSRSCYSFGCRTV